MTEATQKVQAAPAQAANRSLAHRPRVVIVGAGFAGLNAAKGLAHLAVDVTVVDRSNHYTFQPLLYQVALAVLSPADIAQPIRSILRHQRNTQVLMDEVDRHRRRGAPRRRWPAVRASTTTISSWPPAPRTPTSAMTNGSRSRPVSNPLKTPSRSAAASCWPLSWPSARCSSRAGTLRSTSSSSAAAPLASSSPAPSATSPSSTCATTFATSIPPRAACSCSTAGPRVLAAYPAGSLRQGRSHAQASGRRSPHQISGHRRRPGWVEANGQRIDAAVTLWAAGVQASPLGKMLAAQPDVQLDKRGCVIVDNKLNPAGLLQCLRSRRPRSLRAGRPSGPRRRPARHADGRSRRQIDRRRPRRQTAPALPLLRQRRHGHHRPHVRHRQCRVALQGAHEWFPRLVHMGHHPHLLPHRLPQSAFRLGPTGPGPTSPSRAARASSPATRPCPAGRSKPKPAPRKTEPKPRTELLSAHTHQSSAVSRHGWKAPLSKKTREIRGRSSRAPWAQWLLAPRFSVGKAIHNTESGVP